jgi:hypothetical protein
MGATCSRLSPRSYHVGGLLENKKMRGVGATCTAPTTHGRLLPSGRVTEWCLCDSNSDQQTSQAHVSPEHSVVAFPSERRRSPRSDPSLGVSPADRRAWLAACATMHRHSRSARRGACAAGRVTGRPRYSARRAKAGWRRMRKQLGGESGWRCCLGTAPSNQAAGTY